MQINTVFNCDPHDCELIHNGQCQLYVRIHEVKSKIRG